MFTELLQYDRVAIAGGQWWRVLTCHFVHWSADHLLWDALAFAILLAMCGTRDLRRTLATVGLSALTIPLAIMIFLPQMQTYRGLSGIDSALFGLASALLLQRLPKSNRFARSGVWIIGIAFAIKLLIEIATGASVFVDSAAAQFVPVPLAHLVGFAIGLFCSIAGVGRFRTPRYDGRRNERHSRQSLYRPARPSPVRAAPRIVSTR
jgi:rhomboid family GlyGly-CTERM serine protease